MSSSILIGNLILILLTTFCDGIHDSGPAPAQEAPQTYFTETMSFSDVENKTWRTRCRLYRPPESGDSPTIENLRFSKDEIVSRVEYYEPVVDPNCTRGPRTVETLVYKVQFSHNPLITSLDSGGRKLFRTIAFFPTKSAEIISSKLIQAKLWKAVGSTSESEPYGYREWADGEEKDILNRAWSSTDNRVLYRENEPMFQGHRIGYFLDEKNKTLLLGPYNDHTNSFEMNMFVGQLYNQVD